MVAAVHSKFPDISLPPPPRQFSLFFKILVVLTPVFFVGILKKHPTWTSALSFKARVDPSLACFLACVQWIPQTGATPAIQALVGVRTHNRTYRSTGL